MSRRLEYLDIGMVVFEDDSDAEIVATVPDTSAHAALVEAMVTAYNDSLTDEKESL